MKHFIGQSGSTKADIVCGDDVWQILGRIRRDSIMAIQECYQIMGGDYAQAEPKIAKRSSDSEICYKVFGGQQLF